jgi:hypothetical protein
MHAEQDNVEALRRILALKRHEQPPPGYFNSFSSRIIARIEAGERAPDSLWERLSQLWTAFETKPLLAGAVGVTFCGLLTTAFLFSDASGLQSSPISMYAPNQSPLMQISTPAATPLFGQVPGLDGASTGSVDTVQVPPSLFQEIKRPQARLVTFTLEGGGN